MRIVLFDGLLETHVHTSLARALRARGHDVLATGKIGHGFTFPRPGADLSHLERAVSDVLAFDPEWVFVFRPASLPPQLLRRLRRGGARLAAWFSDDPVLFDLSYAPVVEQYDLVLHCGGVPVLAHYERFFGRPTGVNFPFWTDSHAFPYVWGREAPESRAVFLGNVHDEVRRRRYFELSRFGADIRIHGKLGSDYFRLGAGYLDSDGEVRAAGARATFAINIPQWFADHRGLETWFPELGDLGFFEFPSRVVQMMAMGVPTVSVIPGGYEFATYPEMIVVEDISSAVDVVRDGSWTPERLATLSESTVRRFITSFSAEARVRSLERLFVDESWKDLGVRERVEWFASLGDPDARTSPSAPPPPPEAERLRVRSDSEPRPAAGEEGLVRALVVRAASSSSVSPASVAEEALASMGIAASVFVQSDQAGIAQAAAEGRGAVLLVFVDQLSDAASGLSTLDVPKVLFCRNADINSATVRATRDWDVVVVEEPTVARRLRDMGLDCIVHEPAWISPAFVAGLSAAAHGSRRRLLRIASTPAAELQVCESAVTALVGAHVELVTWGELQDLPMDELRDALMTQASFISPRRAAGRLVQDSLWLHAVAASENPFVVRTLGIDDDELIRACVVQYEDAQELGRKAWRLDDSPLWQRSIAAAREDLLAGHDAIRGLGRVFDILNRRGDIRDEVRWRRLESKTGLLEPGASARLSRPLPARGRACALRAEIRQQAGREVVLTAHLVVGGEVVGSTSGVRHTDLLALRGTSAEDAEEGEIWFSYDGERQWVAATAISVRLVVADAVHLASGVLSENGPELVRYPTGG